MKTIIVTDALAADLVAKNEAEYVAETHIDPPAHPAVTAALPPVVAHSENGVRVDQPCPPGTPGTVTLTKTGHVLSIANPTKESFGGYCDRVWRQADGQPGIGNALVMGGQAEFYLDRFGGYMTDGSNWPQAADFMFDRMAGRHAYDTNEERVAQAVAQPQWDATSAAVGHGDTPPVPQNTLSAPQPVSAEVPVPVTQEQA